MCVMVLVASVFAQKAYEGRKFEQLGTELATPNVYRTASGAPGHMYWQQNADYLIKVSIDDKTQRLTGSETITYTNNSPDELRYVWIQLDQNTRQRNSDTYKTTANRIDREPAPWEKASGHPTYQKNGKTLAAMSSNELDKMEGFKSYDGGHKIQKVTDENGNPLKYTINWTMMRVDLPKPLKNGETLKLNIDWYYNINDRDRMGGRGGYNYFKDDKNYLYTITQWFPRMAVYSDNDGWQNKQFMGRGEFALVFGDYEVHITVPADHIVASTGTLQNPNEVLTKTQLKRLEQAKTATKPVKIITLAEAKKNEKSRSSKTKTWIYKALKVRDFAFGSSRKYVWDAMGVKIPGRHEYWKSRGLNLGVEDDFVWAMSYYPKEAYVTYEKYSTETVASSLLSFSNYTIPYPYPKAISVEADNGMEYPMICFNYGRPEKDGTYSERIKYGMIGVIIHEIGHNFFPMIVNSDERQWTWMDEGLNTFVQFLAEQDWEYDYPSRRGPAHKIIPYMKGDKSNIVPIMTNSEQVKQFGANAYAKPATALNILRETILGRELFDYAFKEYSRRWAFKHPTPEDFFRTMEDASGTDLDWFWKGWFFTTEHVDLSIENVELFKIDTKNPDIENPIAKKEYWRDRNNIADQRNQKAEMKTWVGERPRLNDFYNKWDRHETTDEQEEGYKKFKATLDGYSKEIFKRDPNFYQVTFHNKGGLVMPLIVEFTYEDGSKEVEYIPAEIWRQNEKEVTKVFVKDKEVVQIALDPNRETADVDEKNNFFPRKIIPSRFEMFKKGRGGRPKGGKNPMQKFGKKYK